jgi:hypothetical protein
VSLKGHRGFAIPALFRSPPEQLKRKPRITNPPKKKLVMNAIDLITSIDNVIGLAIIVPGSETNPLEGGPDLLDVTQVEV